MSGPTTALQLELLAAEAYDPAAGGGALAWQRLGGQGVLVRSGAPVELPGTHPALGGGLLAWREGERVAVADAATGVVRSRHDAPGAGVLAVSESLLAWRSRDAAGSDLIWTRTLAPAGPARQVVAVPAPSEAGRPALAGGRLLFHIAGPEGSRLLSMDVASGALLVLRREPGAQLSNPATDGTRLLYVRATGELQELRVGPLTPQETSADFVVAVHPSSGQRDAEHEPRRRRHGAGPLRPRLLPPRAEPGIVDTLWTTALAPGGAYVTRVRARRGTPRTAEILQVPVPATP